MGSLGAQQQLRGGDLEFRRDDAGGPGSVGCSNYRGVYSFHSSGANAAFADGSGRLLAREMAPSVFFALVTARAGEVLADPSGVH